MDAIAATNCSGRAADGLALLERLETKLEEHPGAPCMAVATWRCGDAVTGSPMHEQNVSAEMQCSYVWSAITFVSRLLTKNWHCHVAGNVGSTSAPRMSWQLHDLASFSIMTHVTKVSTQCCTCCIPHDNADQLKRAAVELAKLWRQDKMLRNLDVGD